jgi:lysophospholipid acyltransferase (LPLAT)-like uncharacterized protein
MGSRTLLFKPSNIDIDLSGDFVAVWHSQLQLGLLLFLHQFHF